MTFNNIAGIGTPLVPIADPGDKKLSSSECLQAVIDRIIAEPDMVQNQFNIVTKEQSGEMQGKFWPALLDPANWTRLSTHRPTEDKEGNKLTGTNLEVREYENDFWADEGKHMVATISTEFGQVTEIQVVARW